MALRRAGFERQNIQ